MPSSSRLCDTIPRERRLAAGLRGVRAALSRPPPDWRLWRRGESHATRIHPSMGPGLLSTCQRMRSGARSFEASLLSRSGLETAGRRAGYEVNW